VKSGGHATNPGFSSTPDVHISLYRLSEVKYDPDSQTATVGTGLIWDDVYAALEPFGVSVLGGRVTGIGVGGFILGGGKLQSIRLCFGIYQVFRLFMADQPIWTRD
jgi:FAD/FMN-containing dehydrogenase